MSTPAATAAGIDSPPTPDQVRAWLSVPETTITNDQLDIVLASEEAGQAALCNIDPWAPQLTQAIYRRVGRAIAATGAPLGVVDGGDFGSSTLPRWDAEIERYEAPFRRMLLG